MLNFSKLILHNFGSYSHAELDLHNKGFCLVTGKNNYPKDNAISNGSGKSFIWNAICFALVGETLTGLRTNLKNINILDDPSCWVQLSFSENNDEYCITRHIAPKSDLKVIKNNLDVSGKGIRESEKKLNELLPDLTKNLITSTIIIGQGMPNKFSSFSPSGRKELLEKLTRADFMIEDLKQKVGGRQQVLNQKTREVEDALLAAQSQLRVHNATLASKQAQLAAMVKPDFENQLLSKQAEIAELVKQQTSLEQLITEEEQAANISADKQVAALASKATETEAARKAYEQATASVIATRQQYQTELSVLTHEINTLSSITDVCPTCGQKVPGCHKPDLSEHFARVDSLKAAMANLDSVLNQHSNNYQAAVSEINARHDSLIKTVSTEAENRRTRTAQMRGNLRMLSSQLAAAQEQCNKIRYEQNTWDDRYQALILDLESSQAAITGLTVKALEYDAEINVLNKHNQVVKKMDTLLKRDFRGYLLTHIIQYINQKAKDYCQIVFGTRDLDLTIDDNNLNITYCGKMFDNLSGGEKQRVDLILQFAIRNMLTAHLNFNSNILVLDEITDFLDKKSCAAVLELITKELNTIESVFIISHHASSLELPIDSELIIRKNEHGISEIISGV
jgi:DNA repair exonuclease SbcCD ATPase subunit